MNVSVLIDSVVRQTTVLIAQLATSAGARAPLAHMADQVFSELVRELKEQGLGNKVIADMFGLALRTYHNKIQRLSESGTVRGRSLWGAVLEYVQEKKTVLRADVLRRFVQDDSATVRGVLADLVDSGLLYRSGRGDQTTYRPAAIDEDSLLSGSDSQERLRNLVWVAVNRFGPVSRAALLGIVPIEPVSLEEALARLGEEGRIARVGGGEGDAAEYGCESCVIPVGDSLGWEAALFDHYQAMVTAICTKLRRGATTSAPDDWIGGSTYHYDVWEGHPHRDEVAGFLSETRQRAVRLRHKVEDYNAAHRVATEEERQRFIFYAGQTVVEQLAGTLEGEER